MSAFDLINLIVNVAGRVANSAQIARCNKQQCAELAEQAKLVASIVQSMRERANALSPEAIQTLRSINDALESVLTLVASCERSNWLNKYWKASEFDKAVRAQTSTLTDTSALADLSFAHMHSCSMYATRPAAPRSNIPV